MIKPLATAPLEQESEFLTMALFVQDDVLRMPWHTGYTRGGGGSVSRID